jgi:hypothetical protein
MAYRSYPTPYVDVDSEITWGGQIPVTSDGVSKCSSWGGTAIRPTTLASSAYWWDYDVSPSPLPEATLVPQKGVVDENDPYGSFYMLTEDYSQYSR